ncbi:hypothetical protein ACQRC6_08215 [Peptoniphilus sp. SGI.035]|uniref:hypothetical protein n=1 Tax=Peptoniphilus sp. SGI.035 TaxID=3420564 RepID=UPI003D002653
MKKDTKTIDNVEKRYYNVSKVNIERRKRMSDNKKDDQLIKLALITAVISLIEKLIELVIKIINLVGGN